jgi:hypothetical protein
MLGSVQGTVSRQRIYAIFATKVARLMSALAHQPTLEYQDVRFFLQKQSLLGEGRCT